MENFYKPFPITHETRDRITQLGNDDHIGDGEQKVIKHRFQKNATLSINVRRAQQTQADLSEHNKMSL